MGDLPRQNFAFFSVVFCRLLGVGCCFDFAKITIFSIFLFGFGSFSLASDQGVVAYLAVEDAGGVTSDDFDLSLLRALEQRTVEVFEDKMRAALRSEGLSGELPAFRVDSHYVDFNGQRLVVTKMHVAAFFSNVQIGGVVDSEFRRVFCARTSDFDKSIPLSYGVCAGKIKEAFGVVFD